MSPWLRTTGDAGVRPGISTLPGDPRVNFCPQHPERGFNTSSPCRSSFNCYCFFLFFVVTPVSPSLSRVTLAPGAFLERLARELLQEKLEKKAIKERRAKKVCWQVQRGAASAHQAPSIPPGWQLGAGCRRGGSPPPAGNLGLQELLKILEIGKSP